MNSPLATIANAATSLSRNPLGIIALFIILIYGTASLVISSSNLQSPSERIPLVYFLVIFPVLVLGAFTWLVMKHSPKLFGPSDFRDEENYVRIQEAATSLTTAAVKHNLELSKGTITRAVKSVHKAFSLLSELRASKNILWVDDHPENNNLEMQAFKLLGVNITLANSTDDALRSLQQGTYSAIISDLHRETDTEAGFTLLQTLRSQGNLTPFFIYTGHDTPEAQERIKKHVGQGVTNRPEELFKMVTEAITAPR